MTILITGATGTVGRHTVNALLRRGLRPRLLVRDPAVLPARWAHLEKAVGDFDSGPSLAAALTGVDRVFLTSADGPDKVRHELAAVAAAARAGVAEVVKVSAHGAEIGSALPAFDWHGRIEAELAASGLPHVLLRPVFFMENLLMVAPGVAAGELHGPLAGQRVAMVAAADVGECAAAVLGNLGPAAKLFAGERRICHQLTGPAAISFEDVAQALAVATGRPVTFADLTPEQAAPRFAGQPDWLAAQLGGVFGVIRSGGMRQVTADVQRLTGRPATSISDWAVAHAEAFRGEPAQTGR